MGGIFLLVAIVILIVVATQLSKANKKVKSLETALAAETKAKVKAIAEQVKVEKSRDIFKRKYEKLVSTQTKAEVVKAEESKTAPQATKPKRKYTRRKKTTPKKEE